MGSGGRSNSCLAPRCGLPGKTARYLRASNFTNLAEIRGFLTNLAPGPQRVDCYDLSVTQRELP